MNHPPIDNKNKMSPAIILLSVVRVNGKYECAVSQEMGSHQKRGHNKNCERPGYNVGHLVCAQLQSFQDLAVHS